MTDHLALVERVRYAVRSAMIGEWGQKDAEAALDGLVEQLETAREERDLFYDRLQDTREQLETYRTALERIAWSVGADDYAPEDLLPQVRIAREALNPASEPPLRPGRSVYQDIMEQNSPKEDV